MKNITPEIIASAKAAKSSEELIAIAGENGVEMTEEEAKIYFAQLNENGVVSDDELDLVAGGCDSTFKNGERVRLKKRCKCGSEIGIYTKLTAAGHACVRCAVCDEIVLSGYPGTDNIEKI